MLTPIAYHGFRSNKQRVIPVTEQLRPRTCARYLKALADPERLRIVGCLRAGPKNVSELAQSLRDELANVSHHLKVLRRAGLVQAHKNGKFVVYALHPSVFRRDRTGDCLDLGCCRLQLGAS
jgi:ArsR family transcriptional regulator